ncbi:hypothetical protein [Clostridium sp. JNZ J1-5]
MKKKRKQSDKDIYDMDNQESDEYFYFIVGYTSNGAPYGITWEQAVEDGLIDRKELDDDEELPF